jgi:hypothetical protein
MAYLGNVPAEKYISFERQVFTIVNSQTAYTLSHSVTNENDIRLVVNNIVQEPGSGKAYTASGTTLTLSAALVNGTDEMYCVFLGRAVGTVNAPAGSVGTSQLAADAVTSAKLATLTSAMDFQGVASDMRLNFDTTDTVANATPLMAITAKNKTDSVAQISMRRESAVDDGYIALSTQATGGAVTERVRIHSNGVMSASAGVALGVGTANTASNVLDDYEEGTFTPTWGGSSSVSVSSGNYGYYTKIGNVVTVHFGAVLTSTSNSYYQITNAPFQSNIATGNAMGAGQEYGHTGYMYKTSIGDNSTTIIVKSYQNNAVANAYLNCSLTYRTD